MSEKKKFPFSIADLVLVLLVAACIVSAVFAPRIRALFGESSFCTVEVTFLVENVTAQGRSHPEAGQELYFEGSNTSCGTVLSVSEERSVYQSVENPDDQVTVMTLTCRGRLQAEKTQNGYTVGGVNVKNGSRIVAETATAGFEMTVITVKELT